MSNNNNPIRIIYLVYKFTTDGSSIALLNLLDGIDTDKINPLIVMSKRGSLCKELEKRNIPYVVIPFHLTKFHKFDNPIKNCILFFPVLIYVYILNFIATKKLIRVIRSFNANILHTNVGPLQIGFKAANKLGIPHVWHIREYQGGEYGMRPFPTLKAFNKKLQKSYSIAISKGIFNYYSMSNKAKVIYDGVLKSTQTQFMTDKRKYFLFVGQLQESKGIEHLVQAFIEFAKNDSEYNLLVAGWGKENYVSKLRDEFKSENLLDRVNFLGSRRDIFELMSKASAVIVSSFSEGFGFVVAEAMFNGCLVIGNNVSGTKEQFDNGLKQHNMEIAIRYTRQKELVTALRDVKEKGIEYYYPMIMRAQETVCSLYSQERNAIEVYKFYEEIMNTEKTNNKIQL